MIEAVVGEGSSLIGWSAKDLCSIPPLQHQSARGEPQGRASRPRSRRYRFSPWRCHPAAGRAKRAAGAVARVPPASIGRAPAADRKRAARLRACGDPRCRDGNDGARPHPGRRGILRGGSGYGAVRSRTAARGLRLRGRADSRDAGDADSGQRFTADDRSHGSIGHGLSPISPPDCRRTERWR